MPDELPRNKRDWRRAATRNNIHHTQSLTAGPPLVSGSKFKFGHYLRLRVLYIDERDPEELTTSRGFPKERLEEMKQILDKDTDAAFLRTFLQDKRNIETCWSVGNARKSGMFAVALEHLHLISKRENRQMDDSEDVTDLKIVISPPKTRSMTQSSAHYRERLLLNTVPSTPTPKSREPYREPPLSDFSDDFSSLNLESPEDIVSEAGSDLRRARYDFERSDFTPGDEQTVNAALVALIMVLSWLLGRTGRVHHDRARFSISKDAEAYLYSACVDGLIMHLDVDKCNGFMEVKRDFRGGNPSVRRQIAAQMAAFIYEQDVVFAQKETEREKETEKAPEGKGMEAEFKAKENRTKDKDGGNQER